MRGRGGGRRGGGGRGGVGGRAGDGHGGRGGDCRSRGRGRGRGVGGARYFLLKYLFICNRCVVSIFLMCCLFRLIGVL